ncbi:MAG TPA: amino acid adenylation domain-containing protein, partial [Longimicrobiaceae bacterium]
QVRETTLGAYAHQDLPFEKLVEELSPERSLAHAPLFQAMFVLQNNERTTVRFGALDAEPIRREGEATHFDLSLAVAEKGEELGGALSYRAELFDAATVDRMLVHLGVLLEGVAADPRRPVAHLPLLPPAERCQVVEGWNATEVEYPRDACVHELFECQVERSPDAVAVVYERERVSYAELNARANRLAHHLRALGVGPEVLVGICVQRSVEMIVGQLAVLKAGGAYVPLDPGYPRDRLRYMLQDSAPAVVLTQGSLVERLGRLEMPVLDLVGDAPAWANQPEGNPEPGEQSPEQLAYVIYTSGSVGMPKGVLVPHRGLPNVVETQRRFFRLQSDERVLQLASFGFDAAFWDVVAALANGGTLCLPTGDAALPGPELLRFLREHRVTFATLQPTTLAVLPQEGLPDLRTLVSTGDACTAEVVARWAPGRRFFNGYGPTETTIGTTLGECFAGGGKPSIGRPFTNLRAYVLDPHGDPVPTGVAGELYVGGVGVVRGYLRRPELTAERFVPDPFSGETGTRLYRTGDRGRWLASGELEFLGRVDAQVKIRGFRIEPGEIEAVLLGQAGVREGVVAVREDAPGENRLVAYVVAQEGEELSTAELRANLGARLPEYMVPSAFVVLERLPVTANGKVDRRALPAPPRAVEEELAGPRTAAEELRAGIWVSVLRLEWVGVEESFFELGGHSLLATQVVSRVRQVFGVELPLRAVFEAPTLAALAERIEALRGAAGAVAPPVERVPRDGARGLPLSFAQQRLWYVSRLEPESPAYNMPYVLRLRGRLHRGALRASLDALVRRHETLRTLFAETDGVPVQVVHPPAPVPLPAPDLGGLSAADARREARERVRAEAMRPFDLARGPLLRTLLLRLDEHDHVLCFTLHHVVSDGWSMQVLVREVSALYAAFSRGEEPRLPELPVQYADYAVWQREWLGSGVLAEQIEYWKDALRGAPPLLEAPTDRPRAAGQGPRGGSHRFVLPAAVGQGLRALARREGATLFMTALAGWQALLSRYSGEEDVVVGSPIAGRTRRETEGLIGFFVNMLALRADLTGDPTWSGLLGRVRAAALGAYDHQDLPFERLVDELGVERSLAHTPLFQAIFAVQRQGPDEGLSLGEVRLEPFGEEAASVKFDLGLTVLEAEEGLGAVLAYRTALFDAATAARMAGHLEVLLEAMATAPERRLSEVSLLRGSERAQLLHAWSGAETGYTGELCIHELVHAQVLRTPDAPALRFEGESLGYAELFRAASRLAHRLRREGVGPEVRVGICMEPAPEMVVSVLGVLLAGGAYLPLDSELPAERRAYMLRDAAPVLLLTQAALAPRLEGCGVPLLCVDTEAPCATEACAEPPASGVGPDNLAYVIYTSGSTGTPKGVLVEHRGVGNTFLELGRVYGAGPGERSLAYAPLHFDASVADLFVALCSGAELVLARREAMLPGENLLRTLREERITHLKTMPSALAVTPVEPLPDLRTIVTGGEVCPAEQVRRWGEGRRFFNGYGVTEAGIRMTSSAYTAGEGDPPLGRPIANTQLHVLDAGLEPVPVGVAGELYIGGVGAARGYLGRPDLTAERFLPDPHRGVAGARLYRTGDVGRRRADGEVEFLGRRDHQVKVRGFRVELGEIEAALRAQDRVREVVVLLREDAPGRQARVAYVAGAEGAELSPAELRARLRERLPEYMVPGVYVTLERLPVTANGKVDRRA